MDDQARNPKYRKQQFHLSQREAADLKNLGNLRNLGNLKNLEDVNNIDLSTNPGEISLRTDLANDAWERHEHGQHEHEQPELVPSEFHAVFSVNAQKGAKPGVIVVLRNIHVALIPEQEHQMHPFYFVYAGEGGEVITSPIDVKNTLDILRAVCGGQSEPIFEACRSYGQQTKDDRSTDTGAMLLERSIVSSIQAESGNKLSSLLSSEGCFTLIDSIKRLEDFELIAFVVMRKTEA